MNAVEGVKVLLISSGAGWVIWLLGALSVATLAVALERWAFFRGQSCQPAELARLLDERLSKGRPPSSPGRRPSRRASQPPAFAWRGSDPSPQSGRWRAR
jgi:biopolymer transport protein ExbB